MFGLPSPGSCLRAALVASMLLFTPQAFGDKVSLSLDDGIMEGKSFYMGQEACVRVTVDSVPETQYFSNQEYLIRYVLVGLGAELEYTDGGEDAGPVDVADVSSRDGTVNCSDDRWIHTNSLRNGWTIPGPSGGWIRIPYLSDEFCDLAFARLECGERGQGTAGSGGAGGSGQHPTTGGEEPKIGRVVEKVVSTKSIKKTSYFSKKAYSTLPQECIRLTRDFPEGKYYIKVNIQKRGQGNPVLQTVRTSAFFLRRWPITVKEVKVDRQEATTGSLVKFGAKILPNPKSGVKVLSGFVHFYLEGGDKYAKAYVKKPGNGYLGRIPYHEGSTEYTLSYRVPGDIPGGAYRVRAQVTSISGINYSLSTCDSFKIVLPLSVHVFDLKDTYGNEAIRPRIVVGGNCRDWIIVVKVTDTSTGRKEYSQKKKCDNPSGKCEFKPLIKLPEKESTQIYLLNIRVAKKGKNGKVTFIMSRDEYFSVK